MSKDTRDQSNSVGSAALFAAISLLIIIDMAVDVADGVTFIHLGAEGLALTASIAGFGIMLRRYQQLQHELEVARADAGRWQAENSALVAGIGAAILEKFQKWELTSAEADVGLLLLKGLSLQEIADLRRTSERTVREQARTIYRKASLSGRSALAAYFLEDLLPPIPDS